MFDRLRRSVLTMGNNHRQSVPIEYEVFEEKILLISNHCDKIVQEKFSDLN